MEIKTGSWWIDDKSGMEVLVKSIVGESFKESTVCYDVLYSSGERLRRDKCSYKEFLYHNSPKTCSAEDAYEDGFKKGKEVNKDDQNLNYRTGYNDGWHDCEASFELGNEFTDSIQEQAYDEGYDQAIDDLIEAGVIGESDEDYSDGEYSAYEFGAVEDDEEEYCFSKELERVLNGEKAQYEVDPTDLPTFGGRYDENGKLCGFFINTGNEKIGGITANTKEDLVNNPSHYNSDPSGVKCIEITRHRNNNIGNVIKYVWRNGLKDGNSDIQDLEKAAWYLNDEIQRLKDIEE